MPFLNRGKQKMPDKLVRKIPGLHLFVRTMGCRADERIKEKPSSAYTYITDMKSRRRWAFINPVV